MEEGSISLAVLTACVLIGGLILERLLLRWRWGPYFLLGFPIRPDLVPIPDRPEGEGRTATVRWEADEELVRFWADPRDRTAPTGLHGVIRIQRLSGGRFALKASWGPPWSYILAAIWLVVLGFSRGQLSLTIPIAVALVVGILYAYGRFAIRAARELRWAFVSSRSEAPKDTGSPPPSAR